MRFLIDEMFPEKAARLLNEKDHDAVHVYTAGLEASADPLVAARAREEGRALVTENVRDFSNEHDLALVCVLKRNLPKGAAMAPRLTSALDEWAKQVAGRPYIGQHWPAT